MWSYDLIGIMGTCWDSSHDWSAVVDGYGLLRKDRLEEQGGINLYRKQQHGAYVWMYIKQVRADGSGLVGRLVGVCYRLPNQGAEVDEAFFTQLEESLCSQALFFTRDLKTPPPHYMLGRDDSSAWESQEFLGVH